MAAQLRTEYAPRAEEVRREIARLYALRFTEQELKELVAFYKTPLGRKVNAEEPNILDASLAYVQRWSGNFSDEVEIRMRAELKKRGHNLR